MRDELTEIKQLLMNLAKAQATAAATTTTTTVPPERAIPGTSKSLTPPSKKK